MTSNRIIYLDMDGVLADFNLGVVRGLGRRFQELGSTTTRWALINELCQDIYLNLEKLPDADMLVEQVVNIGAIYNYTPAILTALPSLARMPRAEEHKRQWIERYYPFLSSNFNVGPFAIDKQKHARPGHILIDDSHLNIPQWNAAGGLGILHTSAFDTLEKLHTYLRKEHDDSPR